MHTPTLRASLSGTFLQTLLDLVTPLKGHSLSPRSCSPMKEGCRKPVLGVWHTPSHDLSVLHNLSGTAIIFTRVGWDGDRAKCAEKNTSIYTLSPIPSHPTLVKIIAVPDRRILPFT